MISPESAIGGGEPELEPMVRFVITEFINGVAFSFSLFFYLGTTIIKAN